ncbi:MAG: hypothetical protein HWD61_12285 [Parachlamydiaceae bacterium]|nr:MAG: hypothetical protein HWD61_12285 [Parachlamydiaceae bacterium]
MTVRPVKYTIDIPGINEADFQPTRPNSKWGILTCHWPKIIGHDEVATFKKEEFLLKRCMILKM